jgi:glutamate synthase domain-containing protein 3
MTGGEAFVLDLEDKFLGRYNDQLVGAARVNSAEDEAKLKGLVVKQYEKTGSPQAARILADWKGHLAQFWKVTPHVPAAKPIEEKKVEEGKTIITEAITASPKA